MTKSEESGRVNVSARNAQQRPFEGLQFRFRTYLIDLVYAKKNVVLESEFFLFLLTIGSLTCIFAFSIEALVLTIDHTPIVVAWQKFWYASSAPAVACSILLRRRGWLRGLGSDASLSAGPLEPAAPAIDGPNVAIVRKNWRSLPVPERQVLLLDAVKKDLELNMATKSRGH